MGDLTILPRVSEITYFEFILTPTYARDAKGVITDDEQRAIEEAIYKNPDAGVPMRGEHENFASRYRVAVSVAERASSTSSSWRRVGCTY